MAQVMQHNLLLLISLTISLMVITLMATRSYARELVIIGEQPPAAKVVTPILFVIFLTLSLCASNPLPVCADDSPMSEALYRAMIAMNAAMSSVPMTGNPDIDFATMMIHHHQGAIDMAKVELRYGTDSRLKRLAQEIIVTQQSEIALMQLALKRPFSSQSSSSP
jgi:Domain of unknown function (DUF305)